MNEVAFSYENLQDRTPSFVTHDNTDEITAIDLTLDGSIVCTSALDDTAHCYLVANGSKEMAFTDKPYGINNLKFTANNDLIYSNRKGNVGIVKKININNNSVLWLANNIHSAPITSLDCGIFHNLVTVSKDQVMKLWDLKCDKCISSTSISNIRNPICRFDPSSSVVCLGYSNDSSRCFFKFFDVRKVNEAFCTADFGYSSIKDFEFSDDAMHVLVTTDSSLLVLLNSIDASEIRVFNEFKNDLGKSVASMTENSKFVAVGCESSNQVKIFETDTGKMVSQMVGHARTPRRVIWSKHYGVLFTACHNLIYWAIE